MRTKWHSRLCYLVSVLTLATLLLLPSLAALAAGGSRYVRADSSTDRRNDCTNAKYPCSTIQHAIDVAGWEDVIKVAIGTYRENIVIVENDLNLTVQGNWDQNFQLRKANPETLFTVISGLSSGSPVFYLEAFRISNLIIDGFVFTDGYAERGGAIFLQTGNAMIELRNSRIENNIARSYGGGIYVEDEDIAGVNLIITNNIIRNNEAYKEGGGICVKSRASSGATLTLNRNVITNNEAYYSGGGLNLDALKIATLNMENNIIAGNTAYSGGGIHITASIGNLDSVNDTISDNTPEGIYARGNITANLANAIVWGNRYDDIYTGDKYSYVNISYSDVGRVIGYGKHIFGEGNINVDPEFTQSPEGDYRLSPGSPVIDRGICATDDPNDRIAPYEDFEGDIRPYPGDLQCIKEGWVYYWFLRRWVWICFERAYLGCDMGADELR